MAPRNRSSGKTRKVSQMGKAVRKKDFNYSKLAKYVGIVALGTALITGVGYTVRGCGSSHGKGGNSGQEHASKDGPVEYVTNKQSNINLGLPSEQSNMSKKHWDTLHDLVGNRNNQVEDMEFKNIQKYVAANVNQEILKNRCGYRDAEAQLNDGKAAPYIAEGSAIFARLEKSISNNELEKAVQQYNKTGKTEQLLEHQLNFGGANIRTGNFLTATAAYNSNSVSGTKILAFRIGSKFVKKGYKPGHRGMIIGAGDPNTVDSQVHGYFKGYRQFAENNK